MAFVNLSLLIGSIAVAVPVVLHLVMRQQPKRVEFPAVMFLRERRESNRRKLQLRHWILLALRCLAVALLALALARPSVASALLGNWVTVAVLVMLAAFAAFAAVIALMQKRGVVIWGVLFGLAGVLLVSGLVLTAVTLSRDPGVKIGQAESPVAAVLLVDTAPRMQYRHANQTRLEKTKEIAAWLLTQLPKESDVAIADTNLGATVFAVDRGAAGKTLDGLAPSSLARPITSVLPGALDLLAGSEHQRKEIYIFTDRTEQAWLAESQPQLAARLNELENLSLYVIDVGVPTPQNNALGEVSLAKSLLSRSGQLEVGASVRRTGGQTVATVELNVEKYDPSLPIIRDGQPEVPPPDPARRRRQSIEIPLDGETSVQFSLSDLEVGVHHGRLSLDTTDPLAIDNVRYFTFEVRQPWPILVAAGDGAEAGLLTEALAPYEFVETNQARFRCDETATTDLASRNLDDYAVVTLLDPPPLPAATWQRLAAYAQRGGSVAIFLGNNSTGARNEFNSPPAQELLPGKLMTQAKSPDQPFNYDGQADIYLAPNAGEHAMLAAFRDIAANVPWFDFPVFRHWTFEPGRLNPGSRVVVRYNTDLPAVVVRSLGEGHVLTMTTPISDPARPIGRAAWNWLPTESEAWPYFILVNEMMLHLAGSSEVRLNYFTGQPAVIADEGGDESSFLLFTPQGERPQTIRGDDGLIEVPFTANAGHYRLKSTETDDLLGFSVNLPASASDLTRIEKETLDKLLGEERYTLARGQEEIIREQSFQRVGRQFFPFLMVVLAVVLGMDVLLANRFYRTRE